VPTVDARIPHSDTADQFSAASDWLRADPSREALAAWLAAAAPETRSLFLQTALAALLSTGELTPAVERACRASKRRADREAKRRKYPEINPDPLELKSDGVP
jgi:hypothetical protein